MTASEGNGADGRRPRRRKKPNDDLRFVPPGPQTGDSLRIILSLGPSGEPIVDTLLSDRTAASNRGRPPRSFDRVAYVKAIRAKRLKQFEERVLTTALIARRHVMAAKVIADHGTEADMRKVIGLLGEKLEGIVDLILSVCVDARPK
jgi:hypothetical protein